VTLWHASKRAMQRFACLLYSLNIDRTACHTSICNPLITALTCRRGAAAALQHDCHDRPLVVFADAPGTEDSAVDKLNWLTMHADQLGSRSGEVENSAIDAEEDARPVARPRPPGHNAGPLLELTTRQDDAAGGDRGYSDPDDMMAEGAGDVDAQWGEPQPPVLAMHRRPQAAVPARPRAGEAGQPRQRMQGHRHRSRSREVPRLVGSTGPGRKSIVGARPLDPPYRLPLGYSKNGLTCVSEVACSWLPHWLVTCRSRGQPGCQQAQSSTQTTSTHRRCTSTAPAARPAAAQ
jgi:hypothetical protein